jgi:hypothetical protein
METGLNQQYERAEEIKLLISWFESGYADWQEEA